MAGGGRDFSCAIQFENGCPVGMAKVDSWDHFMNYPPTIQECCIPDTINSSNI